MITRIFLCLALLVCSAGWSVAGPVHGAHGVVYGEYQLHAATEPVPAEAGAPVRLDLTLADPNGATVTELEPGAPSEVAIARQGLDVFSRLNPPMGQDGVYSMNLTFPVAGTYFVYLGFTPVSGSPLTAMARITIGGDAPAPLPMEVHVPGKVASDTLGADISLEKTNFGHRIDLNLMSPDGSPLTGVDPASGEMVILSADGTEYFHASPAQGGNAAEAAFTARFPRPGLYKAWATFPGPSGTLELPFVMEIAN